ncbi:MAG: GntR family transcriptional regulator [Deltaproteobacteria bacterium]|nr:GntR family transcriptional regulator [Deltaproteobacteria bacterium]
MVETFVTKASMVYEYIKDAILSGQFPPGKKINPKELSQQLNVSPVPVREAINKLSADGLIKLTPHVGACVAIIDKEAVEELQMIRTELECLVAKLATPQISDEQLKKLDHILKDSERVILTGKYEKYPILNRSFHFGIHDYSPYRILGKMIHEMYERLQLVPVLPWTKERAEKSLSDHRMIFKALSERNGELTSKILKKHSSAPWHAIRKLKK